MEPFSITQYVTNITSIWADAIQSYAMISILLSGVLELIFMTFNELKEFAFKELGISKLADIARELNAITASR